jgi:hypothetical protein
MLGSRISTTGEARNEVSAPLEQQAQQAVRDLLNGGAATESFSAQLHADLENGESVTGYNFLNGTNNLVGDFQIAGSSIVSPQADGTYRVVIDACYTWNDIMDPNGQYLTDRVESAGAEFFTRGVADPYDIHITWHAQTTLILDAGGRVVSRSGYLGE